MLLSLCIVGVLVLTRPYARGEGARHPSIRVVRVLLFFCSSRRSPVYPLVSSVLSCPSSLVVASPVHPPRSRSPVRFSVRVSRHPSILSKKVMLMPHRMMVRPGDIIFLERSARQGIILRVFCLKQGMQSHNFASGLNRVVRQNLHLCVLNGRVRISLRLPNSLRKFLYPVPRIMKLKSCWWRTGHWSRVK